MYEIRGKYTHVSIEVQSFYHSTLWHCATYEVTVYFHFKCTIHSPDEI